MYEKTLAPALDGEAGFKSWHHRVLSGMRASTECQFRIKDFKSVRAEFGSWFLTFLGMWGENLVEFHNLSITQKGMVVEHEDSEFESWFYHLLSGGPQQFT